MIIKNFLKSLFLHCDNFRDAKKAKGGRGDMRAEQSEAHSLDISNSRQAGSAEFS